jgi:hypothetical protein
VDSFADADNSGACVSSAYVMGQLCEFRKKPEDAKWWYEQSCKPIGVDFAFRPLAAVALRRLGEDPYK